MTIQGQSFGFAGKKHSEETKYKMSVTRKGRTFTKEHKDNIAKAITGKTSWWKGKRLLPRSVIHNLRISAANKGHTNWNRSQQVGEKSPNWQGGLSFEPYSPEFNDRLKAEIRKRDGYTCQLCQIPENGQHHAIHHINYIKEDCAKNNLITICPLCNLKVNTRRKYWQNYFSAITNKERENVYLPKQLSFF